MKRFAKTVPNLLPVGIAVIFAVFSSCYAEETPDSKPETVKKSTKTDSASNSKITEYVRLIREDGKRRAKAMETSIVHFEGTPKKLKSDKTVQVDLVAAIHIGDKAYYHELNKRFKDYDVVLYELVIPEGIELDEETYEEIKRGENRGALAKLQTTLSDSFGLVHQLHEIDYTAKNFVHADLTIEEFFEKFNQRGDLANMFSRAMLHSMSKDAAEKSGRLEGRLVASLFSKNKTLTLKRIFAEEMIDQMDMSLWIISGSDESAIISDRNGIALKRLQEQLDDGKTRIAIFYGAAHLPEFEKALKKDFQLKKKNSDWITAWDLSK